MTEMERAQAEALVTMIRLQSTREAMVETAHAALTAERERCARLVENLDLYELQRDPAFGYNEYGWNASIATVIRSGVDDYPAPPYETTRGAADPRPPRPTPPQGDPSI